MKNFEQHIEEIGHDFASGNTPCLLVKWNDGNCRNPQKECFECFKEWALTDDEPTTDLHDEVIALRAKVERQK